VPPDLPRWERKIVVVRPGTVCECFVGLDGLLLPITAAVETSKCDVPKLIKQVQIPGYEQTSQYFQGWAYRPASTARRATKVGPMVTLGYTLRDE
jgi:hypothetical protein